MIDFARLMHTIVAWAIFLAGVFVLVEMFWL